MNPLPGARRRPVVAAVIAFAMAALVGLTGCAAIPGTTTMPPSGHTSEPSTSAPPDGDDAPALAPLPSNPKVLMLGDSLTEAYGASTPGAGWAAIAAATLGWTATIDGVGGTGFADGTATDGRTDLDFRKRLAAQAAAGLDFDLIVLQGGINDWQASPTDEGEHVRSAVAAAQGLWPDAQVIVFGPTHPTTGVDYTTLLPVIRVAATESGAAFIDPKEPEPWMNAANSPLFDFGDGLHLNDAGYAYLAARFVARVESLFE